MSAEEQAVEILNSIKLAGSAGDKVQSLKSLQEIVVKRDPSLIPTFISEILELQVDPSPVVRRAILDFFDAAMQVGPTVATLNAGLQCIQMLLHDSVAATVKRAVISAYPTFRAVAALTILQGSNPSEELKQMWQAASSLRESVVALATGEAPNSGVKLSACKFVEQAAMLLTADVVPAVPGVLNAPRALPTDNAVLSKSDLVREGDSLVGALTSVIKAASEQKDISGPLAITCIRAAMTLIRQRPQFIGRILPTLLALAKNGALRGEEGGNAAETPASGALKSALSAAYESNHAMAQAWKKKVADALTALGAAPAAKQQQQQQQRKRPREEITAPVPQLLPQQEDPSITVLRQLDASLRSLIANQDSVGISQTLSTVSPSVLADLVLLYLPNLPPPHMRVPDHVPHHPWLDTLMEQLWGGAQTPQDPRVAAAVAAPPQDPRLAAAMKPAAPVLPPMPIPEDILAPVELSEQQMATQRRNAVIRILRTHKTSAHALRTALVARLAASAPDSDRITDAVLEYLLGDFHGRSGYEVSMSWLYFLFIEASENQISGSRYEDVLLSIVEGLKERMPPSDRTIVTLLAEAPALPEPKIQIFLNSLCDAGGEWATLALIAARDIALGRPPSRENALNVALEAAISNDSDVRTKAVRLLANRLFPEATMTGAIETFAKKQLDMMGEEEVEEAVVEEEEEKMEAENDGEEMEGEAAAAKAAQEEGKRQKQENEASRRCALYCALCTKKHSLLRGLFEAFAAGKSPVQSAILSNAAGLAKTMGSSAPALLAVVQDPPKGSLELVLAMLDVLTQSGTPSSLLVSACLQLFKACKDPRAVAPALPGMDKTMVLRLLPSVLDLPQPILKSSIARLITSPADASSDVPPPPPLFTASAFLAALHTLDTGGDAAVMRKSMAAISTCISSPELFPAEALATTINQLLTRGQLPPLFMRTVIQSLAAAPKLKSYVVGVLSQLAAKHVWNDGTQWRGWVMAAQQTAPDSFPTLLQLPTAVLEQALKSMPAEVKTQLAAYVQSPQCTVSVPAQTKTLLTETAES